MNEYSKYIVLKSAFESIFGTTAWYALKESNHVPTWRKYGIRALQSIDLAIDTTVEIADEDWRQDIKGVISNGIETIKKQKEIDEIIATIAGTFIHISFNQVGAMPYRKGCIKPATLKKELWRLNAFRSVVYLQTPYQKEQLFWIKQQRKIGLKAQLYLHNKYKRSETNLSFSEWCKNRERVR